MDVVTARMNILPASTDVVIVGAGPTGLALACVLAQQGVKFALIDRLAEGANTSRAAVIHARTLEVLEELGITGKLLAQGHTVATFVMRDRDHALAKVRFHALPSKYPFTLMIPQQITEAVLVERLRELGSEIYRPYVVTDVQQDSEGATVKVGCEGHLPQTIRVKYVVGTDGMHSTVREHAGIGFTGDSYPQSFILADVRMDWAESHDEVFLFLSPEGLVVIAPLPGGRHRIVATVDDAPEHPGIADVQELMDTRGPAGVKARVEDVVWSSRFRVHHRLADHYRYKRILLAGDAAHVHSPAGGQGMNTGIQDGVFLGRLLASVVNGEADEVALDRYEAVRRPVAQRVVAFTDRMTRVATLRSARARAMRNAALGVISKIPMAPRTLAYELSGLRNRDQRA